MKDSFIVVVVRHVTTKQIQPVILKDSPELLEGELSLEEAQLISQKIEATLDRSSLRRVKG